MHTETLSYSFAGTNFSGFLAYDDTIDTPRPAVLIAPDWSGRNTFADEKAIALAKCGYVGFAIDMYGDGKVFNTNDEKAAMMQPLLDDRMLLQQRIQAAYNRVQTHPHVDPTRIGAIGFCFGGLCVLDLARSNSPVQGVVSFHGLLHSPPVHSGNISTKILVLHGYDDPMVKPEQVITFADEMTNAQADWQIVMYGHTMHAFTNPAADDPDFGTVYQGKTSQRAWQMMQSFFTEIMTPDK